MMRRMTLDELTRRVNRGMIGFDLVLGAATVLAPRATLRALGHDEPSPEAIALFRRNGPIWLTFVGAHAVAHLRGDRRDWWALAWLRGIEWGADPVWSRSPGLTRPGARLTLRGTGLANVAMSLGFARAARRARR
jgi:hypothetical protein